MAGLRRNVVLTEANYEWTTKQAASEKALSLFINNLLQRERLIGPIEKQLQRQADRLDMILNQTGRTS